MQQVRSQDDVTSTSNRPAQNSANPFQVVEPQAPLCRINADNQDKQSTCCFWIINFSLTFLVLGLILVIPDVLERRTNDEAFEDKDADCFNPIGFQADNKTLICENFTESNPDLGLIMSYVTHLNQFALLYFDMKISKENLQSFNITQKLRVHVDKLKSHRLKTEWQKMYELEKENIWNETVDFSLTEKDIEDYLNWYYEQYNYDDYSDEQEEDEDDEDDEDDENFIHIAVLLGFDRDFHTVFTDYGHYHIKVEFIKPEQANKVSQMELKALVVNEDNTVYIIVLRYIFLAISIAAAVVYCLMYRKLPSSDKSIEQTFVAAISVLLILFNDPFYIFTVLTPNGFTTFTSIAFVSTFITCLLALVIMFLLRIYSDEGRREILVEKWKRIAMSAYFIILFLLTIITYCVFAYNSQNSPILSSYSLENSGFIGLLVATFIFVGVAILMTVILYVAILCKCRQRNFMWRNILFLSYSLFYIILIYVTLFTLTLVPHNYLKGSQGLIFISYTFCNIYVYVLQYMYYTREKDLLEALQRQEMAAVRENDSFAENNLDPVDMTSIKEKQIDKEEDVEIY